MKRLVLSLAAVLLPLLPLFSQEASQPGTKAELIVIPRFEVGSNSKFGDLCHLYTDFNLNLGEIFSVQLVNHWVSGADTKDLYKKLFYSNVNNLFDYANVQANIGNWNFLVGKSNLYTGGFETDEWDYNASADLNSNFWNESTIYQWGLSVNYTTQSGKTTLGLQAATSPHGEKPFASGLYSFAVQWRGEYGWYSNLFQASLQQMSKKNLYKNISLGNCATFGDWSIIFDWIFVSKPKISADDEGGIENTFLPSVCFRPSEKWEITAKGGIETGFVNNKFAGMKVCFYLLDNLKFHALPVYNFTDKKFIINGGVTWYLHVPPRN